MGVQFRRGRGLCVLFIFSLAFFQGQLGVASPLNCGAKAFADDVMDGLYAVDREQMLSRRIDEIEQEIARQKRSSGLSASATSDQRLHIEAEIDEFLEMGDGGTAIRNSFPLYRKVEMNYYLIQRREAQLQKLNKLDLAWEELKQHLTKKIDSLNFEALDSGRKHRKSDLSKNSQLLMDSRVDKSLAKETFHPDHDRIQRVYRELLAAQFPDMSKGSNKKFKDLLGHTWKKMGSDQVGPFRILTDATQSELSQKKKYYHQLRTSLEEIDYIDFRRFLKAENLDEVQFLNAVDRFDLNTLEEYLTRYRRYSHDRIELEIDGALKEFGTYYAGYQAIREYLHEVADYRIRPSWKNETKNAVKQKKKLAKKIDQDIASALRERFPGIHGKMKRPEMEDLNKFLNQHKRAILARLEEDLRLEKNRSRVAWLLDPQYLEYVMKRLDRIPGGNRFREVAKEIYDIYVRRNHLPDIERLARTRGIDSYKRLEILQGINLRYPNDTFLVSAMRHQKFRDRYNRSLKKLALRSFPELAKKMAEAEKRAVEMGDISREFKKSPAYLTATVVVGGLATYASYRTYEEVKKKAETAAGIPPTKAQLKAQEEAKKFLNMSPALKTEIQKALGKDPQPGIIRLDIPGNP